MLGLSCTDRHLSDSSSNWIGERQDAYACLQHQNALYYDPKLAIFIQPKQWEATKPGVGMNRYSQSFGDPVRS